MSALQDFSQREMRLAATLKDDFDAYSRTALKIRSKSGKIVPFTLNSAQAYVHRMCEKQRAETGRVRAIVVKGRQQGISTYIQGRFYWRLTYQRGYRAFILTHDSEATANIFDITQRYHDNCPEFFKPATGAASANELLFDKLDSGYKVGTAGNKAVGRSSTIQLMHSSEVAYQPNVQEHSAGVMQAVPDVNGTELWLESTSNGPGDYFHNQWQQAIRGENGFIPIFIPWFWQTEYVADDTDFIIAPDEKELMSQFTLTPSQLAWRRKKIRELGGGDMGLSRFFREYPCTAEEAFQESGANKLIPSSLIRSAVNRKVTPITKWKPLWGLDIGGEKDTGDRTALAKRQANRLLEPPKFWRGKNPMQIAGLIKAEYDATETKLKPAFICVDVIFQGAGVVARLREMGLQVIGVNVAESASIGEKCHRLRDELWWKAREWFDGLDVTIPDGDVMELLITELSAPTFDHTSAGKLVVESKDDMKERGIHSPDLADALNLTFAGPNIEQDVAEIDGYRRGHSQSTASWMTA